MFADLVFTGGPVHTLAGATARAVAVRAGRIVAVGSEADIAPLIDAGTEVVELAERALLPGFQDSHVHPVLAGLTMIRCDLHDATDATAALAVIADYAEKHPDESWIVGGGWAMDWFPGGTPGRALLDEVVPDRPVHLINQDGHGAWVNTKALELCGIDADTADPADGRIERESDGFPQGTLHEGAADLVGDHLPEPTPDELMRALWAGQHRLHSVGVTSWQDAMVRPDIQRTYLAAAAAGTLTGRVVGALWWDRERGAEQIPELLARRGGAGRFRATSVKIMQDGVAENFTAAMTSTYLDGCGCGTGNVGLSFVDPAALREHVTRLDAEGFQVHIHAVGDRAAREALDAFAAARAANGPNDNRHHIAHLQVVHPDDVPRFAALGVTANMQPLWAAHEPSMDELTIPFLSPELAACQYPFGDLARTGAPLAAGSDWPVSSANPLLGIHVAVNRTIPGETTAVFLPEQRLALTTALTAYTLGTARLNHHETDTGTVEVGKYADLVILDRDPFTLDPARIADTTVLATYVEGELVYRADNAEIQLTR